MERLLNILEFEVAERLLLGAQLRKNEINPIDYIYGALDFSVLPIEPFQDAQNIELVDKDRMSELTKYTELILMQRR